MEQWKYTCLIGNRCRRSEWRGPIFDRKFLDSRFCACAVKICTKLAYIVVKSPQFYPLHKKIIVVEHDGDGSFQTGSRIYAISAHVH